MAMIESLIDELSAMIAQKANECCNRSDGYEEDIQLIASVALKSVVERERKECLDVINAMINHGDLPGNGLDEAAQRNGLVLAYNAIVGRST